MTDSARGIVKGETPYGEAIVTVYGNRFTVLKGRFSPKVGDVVSIVSSRNKDTYVINEILEEALCEDLDYGADDIIDEK